MHHIMKRKLTYWRACVCMILYISYATHSLSQPLKTIWTGSVHSTSDVFGRHIVIDTGLNAYTSGSFGGMIQLRFGQQSQFLTSEGGLDQYLIRLNPSGTSTLNRRHGGTEDMIPRAMAIDARNHIYIAGSFRGTIYNLGQNPIQSRGEEDIFIIKMNSTGGIMWVRTIGGPGRDILTGIAIDSQYNVYITGHYDTWVDLDPDTTEYRLTSPQSTSGFVSKWNTNGDFVWGTNIGSSDRAEPHSIALSPSGIISICGQFTGLIHPNPADTNYALHSRGQSDAFISSYDPNGSWLRSYQFGGTQEDAAHSLVYDSNNALYVSGYFSSTAHFDSENPPLQLTARGNKNGFLARFNANNRLVWCKADGGYSESYATQIILDSMQRILSLGHFKDSIALETPQTSTLFYGNPYPNIYIQCTDSSGRHSWLQTITGDSNIMGSHITLGKNQRVYITGSFMGNLNLSSYSEPHFITSSGAYDGFIVAMEQSIESYTYLRIQSCDTVVSASGKYSWWQSGTYRDTLQTQSNRDSIIIYTLHIGQRSTDSIEIRSCNSYVSPSGKFEWFESGLYSDTLQSAQGCDSIVIVDLDIIHLDTAIIADFPLLTAVQEQATYQWLLCPERTPITGANQRQFVAPGKGSYAVEISRLGCTAISGCLTYDPGSVQNLNTSQSLFVYPNPTQDLLYIAYGTPHSNPLSEPFSLFNTLGQPVMQGKLSSHLHCISVRALPSGTYFIRVGSTHIKFVVIRS